MSVSRPGKERFLARNAEEAKKYAVLRKVALRFFIPAVLLIVIIYIISVLYTRFGSFTITVDKYDVSRYNLCLSETPDFDKQTSRLNARAAEEITNTSVHDLPADLDSINGKHNGENYLAYTFYLKNVGENTVTYWSWYGFGSRVDWCACFVSWCANECGYIETGVIPKFTGCVNGVQWFKDRGHRPCRYRAKS